METKPIKKAVITCPHCGWEYVPSEIFVPGQLIGKPDPSTLVKDALGKILYVEYPQDQEPEQVETYVCDNCEKTFVITPTVSYKTQKEEEVLDFKDPYVSLL